MNNYTFSKIHLNGAEIREKFGNLRNKLSPGQILNHTFKVLLIVLPIVLLTSVALAGNNDEAGTNIEGFSLFRYEKNLKWKLSGEEASKGKKDLVVRDFNLVIKKGEPENDDILYEFSGKEIRLQSGERERAWIPGAVEIRIGNKFRGTAGQARYDFSTGKITGRNLNLVWIDQKDGLSLEGKRFEYSHGREVLLITGGFQFTARNPDGTGTEISGGKLTWNLEKEIRMEENVVSKTDSGWELSAREMVLNPDTDTLECSGRVVAVKDEVRVQGESIVYNGSQDEISVKSGRLVLEEK